MSIPPPASLQGGTPKKKRPAKQSLATRIVNNFIGFFDGSYPKYLPNHPPGKATEDITKESYDFQIFQAHLFQGAQLTLDLTPVEHLKLMVDMKAGTPGKDATFHPSAITFSNNYFLQAQWDGISTVVARGKWKPSPRFDITASTRVGSDYNKNFIADIQTEYNGKNYTIEFQYEGVQENLVTASYNQTILSGLYASTSFIYSLAQKSSIISYTSRFEYNNYSLYGSIILPQIPDTNILIPNRIITGFSVTKEGKKSATRFTTEFQINPSEEQPFDSIVIGYYDVRTRSYSLKFGIDTMMKVSMLFNDNLEGKFGNVNLSFVADYLKEDYKFGLGFTINQ